MGFMDTMMQMFGGGDSSQKSSGGFFDNIGQATTGTPPIMPQQNQPGGGDLLSSILLGIGAPLLSRLMPDPGAKATKNLGKVSNEGTNIGKMLMDRAAAGKLTDPQQAQVDNMKKEQNARNAQYLASLGIPVSSANVQYQNKVDQDAVKMANDLINQSFEQGTKALGLGGQASYALINAAAAQKKDLANTIAEVAKGMGGILNNWSKGTPDAISAGAQTWTPDIEALSDPEGMGY